MQNGHIQLTSPTRLDGYTGSIGVGVVAVRCVSVCALLLRVINCELTVLCAWLTPPALNIK